MFSRRRSVPGSLKYSREFFQSTLTDLKNAGFAEIEIKLPLNVTGENEYLVSPEELLDRERNYPSLILLARNKEHNETMKILFVNRNSKAVFVDDTFPSGESVPPALYVQSPDPARAYSLFEFFHEHLQRPGVARFRVMWLFSIISGLFLISEVLTLVYEARTLLALQYGVNPIWDVLLSAASLIILFQFFAEPRGLWVKRDRELGIWRLLLMAVRGDLKDNPIVTMVVTIIGTIIAAMILRILGIGP